MSKAQLVITAVMLEGRSKSEVARDYDVSRQWVQQLVRRYATEGATAFEPRSRRPTKPTHTCATNNGSVAKLAHWYPFCWRSSLDWHGAHRTGTAAKYVRNGRQIPRLMVALL
jgi:transposase-like protein